MHANHLLFSVEIIFNSCQSFVLHTLSSSFLNYKGGCGRQCDFINRFCLLSVDDVKFEILLCVGENLHEVVVAMLRGGEIDRI